MRRSSRRAVVGFVFVALAITAAGCSSQRSTTNDALRTTTPAASTSAGVAETPATPNASATALFDQINAARFGVLIPTSPPATPYPPWLQDASFVSPSQAWALRRDDSGVWHTSDAGNHWSRVGSVDFTPQFIAFRDATHGLIAGVREPDCYDACDPASAATTDGGRTWRSVALPGVAIRLSFSGAVARLLVRDCQSPCTLGSAVRLSDYTSPDDGASWHEAALPTVDPQLCKNNYTSLRDVYWLNQNRGWALCVGQAAMLHQAKQLLMTADGGATWRLISQQTFPALPTPGPDIGELPGPGVTVIFFRDAQDGWMGTEEPGQTLQRTTDGGRTWTPVEGDTRVQRIEFISDNDGYVVMHYRLWWTSDGGDHWQQLPLP